MTTGDAIIKIKRSNATGNAPSGLTYGEPAVNLADQKMWVGGEDGTSTLFFAGPSGERPTGKDGQIQYIYAGGFSASNNLAFVNDVLGVTGEFVATGRTHIGTGLSCDGGATFGNDVVVQGGISCDGSATFTNTVTMQSDGDTVLHLRADMDDSGEGDNPFIKMTQDGTNHAFGIGMIGDAGDRFTGSIANAAYLEGWGGKDIQFANNDLARYTIHAGGMNHFHSGVSADAGATFGGNVNFKGNLLLDEDAEISIGGDTEKIVFNGSGGIIRLGATEIQIDRYISHYGDTNTWMEYPSADAFRMQLGGTEVIAATPTGVHIPVGISADAGATFGARTRIYTDDATAKQLTLGGASDNNKRLYIGYDTTNNHGSITAVQEGTAYSNLALQNGGGNVGIGTDSPSEKLQVVGKTHLTGGLSADAGATFGGDVTFQGDIFLPEDGEVGIGGDTEKIIFNGSGSGSSSIDIKCSNVDFGLGSGGALRSHGDTDTKIVFVNDFHGGGNDGLQFVQSGNTMCYITPTQVHFPLAAGISADAGATFGGDVAIQGGLTCDGTGTFENSVRISSTDDAVLHLVADTDNATESHNPHINFSQDGGLNTFSMGMNGAAGDAYTGAYSDRPYLTSYWGFQLATGNTARVSVDSTGLVHLHNGLSADGGATFGGPVNLIDNELSRPKLKDYGETVNAVGTITDDITIDIEAGNVATVTVGGDCEFDFENFPGNGIAGTVTLIMTNAGNHTTTWNSTVKWPGDNAPAGTSGGIDILSFMTIDAGTNIYGFVGGINFS